MIPLRAACAAACLLLGTPIAASAMGTGNEVRVQSSMPASMENLPPQTQQLIAQAAMCHTVLMAGGVITPTPEESTLLAQNPNIKVSPTPQQIDQCKATISSYCSDTTLPDTVKQEKYYTSVCNAQP